MTAENTSALDGAIRDGRHHMQVRVYYEDTDFSGFAVSSRYTKESIGLVCRNLRSIPELVSNG